MFLKFWSLCWNHKKCVYVDTDSGQYDPCRNKYYGRVSELMIPTSDQGMSLFRGYIVTSFLWRDVYSSVHTVHVPNRATAMERLFPISTCVIDARIGGRSVIKQTRQLSDNYPMLFQLYRWNHSVTWGSFCSCGSYYLCLCDQLSVFTIQFSVSYSNYQATFDISSRFSSNSEAFASESLENLDEMFPRY